MKISEAGLNLIKSFEGCPSKNGMCYAYDDGTGIISIGWGITNACASIIGQKITMDTKITQEKADEWLEIVVNEKFAKNVEKYNSVYHWNQNQFDSMCSYSYNIGSIDALVDYGKRTIAEISADIINHDRAKKNGVLTVLPGLTKRRKAEKVLFDTPIFGYKPTGVAFQVNTPDIVIKIALAEVNYIEKSRTAYKKDPKVLYDKKAGAGSDNYTKYGKEMHDIYPAVMDFPAAWCDAYVDWCFYIAYGISTAKSLLCGDFDDYTVASAQMYKNKKSWYTSKPEPGDQIFFKNASGGICHTGIIYKVDSNYVYTTEGNTSSANEVVPNGGCVIAKQYPLNYSRIAGYGRPRYDMIEEQAEQPRTYTVIKGDTLSGIGAKVGINWRTIADLNGIVAPFNISVGQVLKLTGTTCNNVGKFPYSFVVNTTSSNLNVRAGAGTNYSIVKTLKKGSKNSIIEEKNGFGRLSDKSGWVSLTYVKKA